MRQVYLGVEQTRGRPSPSTVNWHLVIASEHDSLSPKEFIDAIAECQRRLLDDGIPESAIKVWLDAEVVNDYGDVRGIPRLAMTGSRPANESEIAEQRLRQAKTNEDNRQQQIAAAKARLAELERGR